MGMHIWGSNYHEFSRGLGPATRSKQLQDDRARDLKAGWPLRLLKPLQLSCLCTVSQGLGIPRHGLQGMSFARYPIWICAGRRETHLPGERMLPKVSMSSW